MTATIESRRSPVDFRPLSVSMITSFPPTVCGIGRFSRSLIASWSRLAPNTRVTVARVAAAGDATISVDPMVGSVFDPASPAALGAVARRAGRSDVVLLQHEYGLYGPNDGEAVVDLIDQVEVPVVSVLHTVRAAPTVRQRRVVEQLGEAGTLVVPSATARHRLISGHAVDPANVEVIPHGSSWSPWPRPRGVRRHLITWGLIGPGKGIERSLRALARLDLDPPVTYDIVGQTHPKVLAHSGQAYRRSIEGLVAELGLEDRVRFVDRYIGDEELELLAGAADVVVIPYDNDEQVCSGVLTDAIAVGRPVVATAFPHARELLADGAGIVAEHTSEAVAAGIRRLLTEDTAFDLASEAAATMAASLSWDGVGTCYLGLLRHLRSNAEVA